MYTWEKRTHPRRKVFLPDTCEGGNCNLLDISDGGACIISVRAYKPGRLVMLRPPLPKVAKVRWITPATDTYKIGLQFLDS